MIYFCVDVLCLIKQVPLSFPSKEKKWHLVKGTRNIKFNHILLELRGSMACQSAWFVQFVWMVRTVFKLHTFAKLHLIKGTTCNWPFRNSAANWGEFQILTNQ